jgi:tetratricopeptide (TPR) repeat protein
MTPSVARAGESGRPALAAHLRLLAVAHREDPTNVGILVAEGGQLLLLGRYAEAIAVLERAERLEPRAEVFVHLARARWLAGLRDPALQDFRRAVTLNPRLRASLPREIAERLERLEKAPLG